MKWGVIFIFYCSQFYLSNLNAQTVPISQGKWVKIAVSKQGMYQITGSQLKAWGFNVPFASHQVQLYNYNTANLVEKNMDKMAVGLFENSIDVQDGNDGQFDQQDHFLFYSQGNVQWQWNVELQKFEHNKNLQGDSIYARGFNLLFYYFR
ncbi:MAG: hypothetical protein NTZ82_06445 [Bacteroidetes bacterium]|nr:hypothetical protein [Bacteroidota bacterium]